MEKIVLLPTPDNRHKNIDEAFAALKEYFENKEIKNFIFIGTHIDDGLVEVTCVENTFERYKLIQALQMSNIKKMIDENYITE